VRDVEGIYYIRFHTNGMNYHPHPSSVYASYESFEYIDAHWDEEKALLVQWCTILGLNADQYVIKRPAGQHQCIEVEFLEPLNLEEPIDEESESEEGAEGQEEAGTVEDAHMDLTAG
jgi:hypothetical protein